jgi:dCMP deaminase
MNRPSWDEYFIKIAQLTSERSNCIKRRVGCLVVKDNRILSLGYNGTPVGTENCFSGGCNRCMEQYVNSNNNNSKKGTNNNNQSGIGLDLCMCLHAEENALLFVSKNELENSTIYVTLIPCISCVKKIIQCNIKRVIYIYDYSPELDVKSKEILQNNNIEIIQWNSN